MLGEDDEDDVEDGVGGVGRGVYCGILEIVMYSKSCSVGSGWTVFFFG
jgi:hypothetical protein